ncbi:MAG: hypothetical protein JWN60_1998 [Acidobacteria bacterium]|jgi:hypothetical protein|nr:hypothetical protein [Acidobacteriota bacterium]
MSPKNLKIAGNLALFLSAIVTILAMLNANAWSLDPGGIPFIVWAISPYFCFMSAYLLLRRFSFLSRTALIFFVVSFLMLVFTLLAYVGTLGDDSSSYALIFVFMPLYLYIGSFFLFGLGLVLSLLFKSPKSENI